MHTAITYSPHSSTIPFQVPMYISRVAAGFPSPADDYKENQLDLNVHLIKRPASTFFLRVEGNSMVNAGIHDDDIIIVDKSIAPKSEMIIVAVLNGELIIRKLKLISSKMWLIPESLEYQPIQITRETDFQIWGVVAHVIHSFL